MIKMHTILASLLLSTVFPAVAAAYFSPEEVLLSNEFFLPPSQRETENLIHKQQQYSNERRQREQDILFSLQHPEEPTVDELFEEVITHEETLRPAAPELNLSEREMELLKTIRLVDSREERMLNRIYANQRMAQLRAQLGDESLHGGAPLGGRPLAPTGAGGVLAATVMLGAVGWTIWRVRKAEKATAVQL